MQRLEDFVHKLKTCVFDFLVVRFVFPIYYYCRLVVSALISLKRLNNCLASTRN